MLTHAGDFEVVVGPAFVVAGLWAARRVGRSKLPSRVARSCVGGYTSGLWGTLLAVAFLRAGGLLERAVSVNAYMVLYDALSVIAVGVGVVGLVLVLQDRRYLVSYAVGLLGVVLNLVVL